MKLQKVLVVLGISTCLLATKIQGTFGLEGDAEQEGADVASENQEAISDVLESQEVQQPEETASEQPVQQPEQTASKDAVISEGEQKSQDMLVLDNEEQADSTVNDGNKGMPEDDGADKEEPSVDGENTGDLSKGEAETDTGDASEEDGSDTEDTSNGKDNSEEGDDLEGVNKPEKGDTSEEGNDGKGDLTEEGNDGKGDLTEEGNDGKGDLTEEEEETDDRNNLTESGSDVIPDCEEARELIAPSANPVGKASNQATDYFNLLEYYTPSSEFIDNREKIKYSVEMPIEGLPKFITTEMVVGALKCQDETGYPASVTIAQIIQESGFGKYGPEGDKGQGLSYLAHQYNNLFGIKGRGPAGTVDMGTGEQNPDGSTYHITANFRVYHTYTECIEDRAKLLDEVYSDLTFGVRDANTFAMKIGKRWATSLTYGQDLIRQMKRYDLYRLDELTVDEFSNLLGTFVNPCPGSVLTSSFGYRTAPKAGASTYHMGIDMGTGEHNIPTYAADAGTVIYAGPGGVEGNFIVIAHEGGLVTKYMHHDEIYVETGDEVEKGQQIGLSGSTGNSTGNHLHFQVEKDGEAVDPLLYLNIQ